MISGFLNFLKPPGMTSHDVVSFVRRIYGLKRVGHAGTLDPAAAGVLPVALGQATRLIEYMTEARKQYRVELTFGYQTDSGDEAGQIIARSPVVMPSQEQLQKVFAAFVGKIEQIPPIYSAIKINGKKLYELARQGEEVPPPPPRTVIIDRIDLLAIRENSILFDVMCSKGTYIRSLGIDIAQQLGMHGTVTFLLRTAVGDFDIAAAVTPEEVELNPSACLLSAKGAVRSLPRLQVTCEQADHFIHGRPFMTDCSPGTICAVYNEQGSLLGIGKQSACGTKLLPQKVLGAEERV